MAEGLFNAAAPAGWRAGSAGTDPSGSVRLQAVAVMREIGIDISGAAPKSIAAALAQGSLGPRVDLVVGLCAEEACPVVPGARSLHWPLPNPAGGSIERYREVRDELARRIQGLLAELTGADEPPTRPTAPPAGADP
jgi:protein-tyrosine-phosphatase